MDVDVDFDGYCYYYCCCCCCKGVSIHQLPASQHQLSIAACETAEAIHESASRVMTMDQDDCCCVLERATVRVIAQAQYGKSKTAYRSVPAMQN